MSARFATARLRGLRYAPSVNGAALLATLLILFMTVMTAETQACSHRAAAGTAGVAYGIKPTAIVTAAISRPKADVAPSVRTCCGDASHSNGAGCWHGCCSSCSAAVAIPVIVVPFEEIPTVHALPRERHVAFVVADGHFRPPRLLP